MERGVGVSKWEKERKKFVMLRGVRGEEVDERKRRNELEYKDLGMRDREDQVEKRRKR